MSSLSFHVEACMHIHLR